MKNIKKNILLSLILALALIFSSCSDFFNKEETPPPENPHGEGTDEAFIQYNGGVPEFEIPSPLLAYEYYSPLDGLGRCGKAEACLGPELMPPPDEERESLSGVTPSGWCQAQYKGLVEGDYLYNRCHLIGFQLAGEQANKKNLITGTRFLNIEGMLPFENMIADYIKETGNHVMYRATPVYAEEYDLVPSGVILEALSVEDGGDGISFAVYSYNKQPGVVINYRDGSSHLSGEIPKKENSTPDVPSVIVINISSKKFHLPTCSGVSSMKPENREERSYYDGIFEKLQSEGFSPCGTCKPLGDAAE